MIKRTSLVVATSLTIGLVAGAALDHTLGAQQTPITRTMLLTTDDPAAPSTSQLVMAMVEVAPGGQSGKHRHPGIEIGYVLDGSLDLEYENGTKVTANTGQTFRNEGVHNGINRGTKPAKLLAVYAVEKGKPLTEAVQ